MSSGVPPLLRVKGLTKSYGAQRVLRGVTLAVAPGEVCGLLGPNGAGKTTTLECILGLRTADTGEISLAGHDARRPSAALRRQMGAQLQSAALQDALTPRQALALFSGFYENADSVSHTLRRFDLEPVADRAFARLSGGFRQRLFLALAVIHRPSLLVLDEPSAGLDPNARRELHTFIRQLAAEGLAVLLSTHDLQEAAHLCDRITVLHGGVILREGTPSALVATSRRPPRVFFRATQPCEPALLSTLAGVSSTRATEGGWELESSESDATLQALVAQFGAAGLQALEIRRPTLEDVYFEATGQAWTAAGGGTSE